MLLSHRIRFFIALIVVVSNWNYSRALAQKYKTYDNSRYNFSIIYPSDIDDMFESMSGDGCHFKYNDGFDMSVYGFEYIIIDNNKFFDVYHDRKKELKKVTYKYIKKNKFVLSGYTPGGLVYYTKQIGYLTLVIKYPKSLRHKFNKLTGKISRSFKSTYGK